VSLDPAVCDPGSFGSDQLYNDVWYNFTAAANGEVEVSTCNLVSFDSRIAIYLGASGDPADAVACNDDGSGCAGFSSYLTFQATAGETYTVRVGGFGSGDSGTGTMDVTWLSNDVQAFSSDCNGNGVPDECEADCDGDGTPNECEIIAGAPDCNLNGVPDNCDVIGVILAGPIADNGGEALADAVTIGPGSHGVDTSASTTDGVSLDPAVCDPGSFGSDQLYNDVWYSFTASANGEVEVSTCNQVSFDSRIAIYLGASGDPADAVACNDDGSGCAGFSSYLTFQAAAGVTYTVRVGGFGSGDSGTGTMDVAWLSSDVSPFSSDCDANGEPDECQTDSDSDGSIDACDADDDNDGIDDVCDIDSTGGADCDSDGQDDSCETDTDMDGSIDDCDADDDGDGIDDVCDVDSTGGADCDSDGQDDSCQTDTDMDGSIDACDADDDGDGIDDVCDIDSTGGADCDSDGQDDSCETDTDMDGSIDDCDADDDGDGIDDVCDIDSTGGADCDSDGQDDSCQTDTDSDGIIDACDPDDDGDGIDDVCDVDSTGGADCDGDGLDDSCETDTDGDGTPDDCEADDFIRGNANNDGNVDLGDGILILGYLFSGDAIPCLDAADCDDNGQVDITDAIYLFTYQFAGGAAPLAPFPACGTDPTDGDALDCLVTTCP
jgi:hypothetical protein